MRISSVGLISLTIEELFSIPISHLVSGVDAEDCPRLGACGTVTSISGYTEWVSKAEPAISIGWDWCIHTDTVSPRWKRVGLPRSNVRLVDKAGADTGWARNFELLATVADALPWCEQIPQAVAARYA